MFFRLASEKRKSTETKTLVPTPKLKQCAVTEQQFNEENRSNEEIFSAAEHKEHKNFMPQILFFLLKKLPKP